MSPVGRRQQSPSWNSGQQSRGFDDMRAQAGSMYKPLTGSSQSSGHMQNLQTLPMGSMGGGNQVLMVVPQGQAGAGVSILELLCNNANYFDFD